MTLCFWAEQNAVMPRNGIHRTIACNGILIIGNYGIVNRRWRPWAGWGVEEGAGCVPIT